jgi:hypothetical protein
MCQGGGLLAGHPVPEITLRIPVDRRHNAKIDYPALRRLLSNNRDAAAYVSGVPTS